ncbi:MAG: TniB family NTP-binding protein [Roseiarcus sp.]|jgi:hypothetical protein
MNKRFTPAEVAARTRHMKGIVIEHEQVRRVEQELATRIYEGGAGESNAAALTMLVAPSGCGKSKTVEQCNATLANDPAHSDSALPILYVSLPAQCSIKNMTTEILRGLKDPLADRHSTTGKNSVRIIDQLRGQKVKLFEIDEFQHLISGKNVAIHQEATDWLKQLLDGSGVPVVCIGLPEGLGVIARHEQLRRRTAKVVRMQPFVWDHDGPESDKFRAFLDVYEGLCEFREKSNLARYELAARIFIASDGLIGTVTQLCREAARTSMSRDDGPDCMTLEDFAEAYAGLPFEKANPFDPTKKIEEIVDAEPAVSRRAGPRKPKT